MVSSTQILNSFTCASSFNLCDHPFLTITSFKKMCKLNTVEEITHILVAYANLRSLTKSPTLPPR